MFRFIFASTPDNIYNRKLDLSSLGTITFELLTGEESFSGNDIKDIISFINSLSKT